MLKHLLDRPIAVTMALLAAVVLGIVSIGKLPVSLIPDVDIPYVTVQARAPELSAPEMEDAVIKPLRNRLMQVEGLDDIRTEAQDGMAVLKLTFSHNTRMQYAYVEVNEQVDRAMGLLPKMERPIVMKASATDIPAFYITMTLKDEKSDHDFSELSRYARNVAIRRLEQLKEVAMVDVTGLEQPEIFIRPKVDVLAELGLQPSSLESLVKNANISLGRLSIRDGEYHFAVRFQSFANSSEDVANLYFRYGGRIFQLKDVADVIERSSEKSGMAYSDGRNAIVLAVIGQSDARMADLRKAVQGQIGSMKKSAPGIIFTVTRDQTQLLDYSISNLVKSIIAAILLTCLVLLFFMKEVRLSVLVSVMIPLSLVISMAFFRIAMISINIISLSGLLLGVGMMVDNAIILSDNILSKWRAGALLRNAVVDGTKDVAGPMLSSVLTTCAVFLPLIFIGGMAGKLFYDQAMAITIVLFVSWIITVTALPVYFFTLYKHKETIQCPRFLARLNFQKGVTAYEKSVSFFLKHRALSWIVLVTCSAIAVVCFIYMPKALLPEVEYSDMIVDLDWGGQISLEQNHIRTKHICETLENNIETEQLTALIGGQQFILPHSGSQTRSQSSLYVKCPSPEALENVKDDIKNLIEKNFPETKYEYRVSGNIFDMVFSSHEPYLLAHIRPTTDAGIEVRTLCETVSEIEQDFPENVDGKIHLNRGVLFTADPEIMALYGVSVQSLYAVIKDALNGNRLFEIVQGTQSIPVVMGTDAKMLSDIFENTVVHTSDADIPVKAFMKQCYEENIGTIVSDEAGEFYPLEVEASRAEVHSLIDQIRESVVSTGRYDVDFSGRWFSSERLVHDMLFVLIVAVLLLFLILAAQFESLVQPVIILSEIVVDIAVSLAFLWIAGETLNLMSLIGIVVISGIVINDSILKIDTINNLRRTGMPVDDAILEAGHLRIKSIVMTSLTTILAVCPFLSKGSMGADLQYPMTLVIIVGMVVGTLVSLVLVPSFYSSIYSHRNER